MQLKVQFTKWENVSGHTEYTIQVSDKEQTWLMVTRYSELKEIHEKLKKVNKSLPEFPPSKLIGATNPTFVNGRQKALQHYVCTLVGFPDKYNNIQPIIDFLMKDRKTKVASVQGDPTKSKLPAGGKTGAGDKPNMRNEVVENFAKKLVQIPKKGENMMVDDQSEQSKQAREFVPLKASLESQRACKVIGIQEESEVEDMVLNKVVLKAAAQLNELISAQYNPANLKTEHAFVQKLSNQSVA